ncbi:hypothetical protein, partial [Geothermobacter hydrogeniphilus]|uniref:hypothetical protein n=1 Tax=Geothermobacter hydrogeniphilus TaxID=1969733 RepID=UPI001E5BDD7C
WKSHSDQALALSIQQELTDSGLSESRHCRQSIMNLLSLGNHGKGDRVLPAGYRSVTMTILETFARKPQGAG